MNPIQQAIDQETHTIEVWQHYRPDLAAKAHARLKELYAELGEANALEMEILKRFESQPGPIPKPPILNPLGIDEVVEGQFIRDHATGSKRPR